MDVTPTFYYRQGLAVLRAVRDAPDWMHYDARLDGWTAPGHRLPELRAWASERGIAELFLPDFTLRHGDGREALVEVVGFWAPEYLERKLRKVAAAGLGNLILVVYQGLAAGAARRRTSPASPRAPSSGSSSVRGSVPCSRPPSASPARPPASADASARTRTPIRDTIGLGREGTHPEVSTGSIPRLESQSSIRSST
jgi:hypothetical protein